MKKIYILLRYLLLLVGILDSLYLIHRIILTGRTIYLSGEAVVGIAIDNQGRVWARTSNGVSMIAEKEIKSYRLNTQYLSWPNDFRVIRIDKNDHVWVIASTGVYEDAQGVYSFDGKDWTFKGWVDDKYDNENGWTFTCEAIQTCDILNSSVETNTDINLLDYEPFLIIGSSSSEHFGNIVGDEQGNAWVGTFSGLIHFSPDFRPAPFPLTYLHIFLSTGGYWFLGLILTGLYWAIILDVLRQVSLGIGLGLGVSAIFSGLFGSTVFVANSYYINPGVFSTLGGIVGGLIGRRIVRDRGKEKSKEMNVTIIGIIIGSVIGICPTLPRLFAQ